MRSLPVLTNKCVYILSRAGIIFTEITNKTGRMAIRTTIGWSLITSGVVTLLLAYLPYPSVYWGIGLLVVGILIFVTRRIY